MIDQALQVCLDEVEDIQGLKADNDCLIKDLIKARHERDRQMNGLESQKIVSKTYYDAINSIDETHFCMF